ncbi:MAG: M16 family metallopeptidase [Gammaproteobacteria bacterium]
MIRFLHRIARDNLTVLLLVLLMIFGAFVAWQLSRLAGEEHGTAATAALAAKSQSVAATVEMLQEQPASRPELAVQRWTTASGARVLFVPSPDIPMLDVRVLFDAGAARDGAYPGLARFTSAMIGEGTPTRSTDEIAGGFESIGAQFGTSSFRDMALVELRTLSEPEIADAAVALFADVVAHPSFPEPAVARVREQMLVGLRRDEERPATIAHRSFIAALYLMHPYASPVEGTADSVRRIDRESLRAFHKNHYVANNAVIAITGAVERPRAEQIAALIANALPTGAPAPELPQPPVAGGDGFHVTYDSQQTHIFLGLPSVRRGSPDEAVLSVANQILGGDGLTSLLADAVRNQRGLAYSVGSNFQSMRVNGPFVVNLQTRNDGAGEALAVVQDVLKKFSQEGPTEAQLIDARRQLAGSYPLQFASNSAIVGTIGMLGFYNLPDDHIAQQLARIEQVTAAEVRDAFRRHVPLDRLITVTLGPEKPVVPAVLPPLPAGSAPTPAPAAMPHHPEH